MICLSCTEIGECLDAFARARVCLHAGIRTAPDRLNLQTSWIEHNQSETENIFKLFIANENIRLSDQVFDQISVIIA